MSSPAHEWFRPRLRALVEDAGQAGFAPDIAVAVITDLMNGPEFSAPPPAVDDEWNRDPGEPSPQIDLTEAGSLGEAAPGLMSPNGLIPVHKRRY